jgi:hypothetical protein
MQRQELRRRWKFELVINFKAAKALGGAADPRRVIE